MTTMAGLVVPDHIAGVLRRVGERDRLRVFPQLRADRGADQIHDRRCQTNSTGTWTPVRIADLYAGRAASDGCVNEPGLADAGRAAAVLSDACVLLDEHHISASKPADVFVSRLAVACARAGALLAPHPVEPVAAIHATIRILSRVRAELAHASGLRPPGPPFAWAFGTDHDPPGNVAATSPITAAVTSARAERGGGAGSVVYLVTLDEPTYIQVRRTKAAAVVTTDPDAPALLPVVADICGTDQVTLAHLDAARAILAS